ncbi:replication-associated recombination protein A [Paenibacillus oenotherae]|uniref:Replication-associated recombination protein A n=1 Tax=Paenibacillus oenotherae TaxID=1435645 RepID=A0ABS7DD40_9BACL|nr:replication-associated recombination protein A [Paenibacillus oenotherae]MBW7477750.1 replication-associated recombination protein A [Paenibacillus oenotherae]
MDLFDLNPTTDHQPLAERMRPQTLDEYFGQSHILAPGKVLRKIIETDKITSMILQGPPSSGKTSLASIISQSTKANFVRLNAVSLTVAELREAISTAKDNLKLYGQKTIVMIDEIHAMKSNVQMALLPHVEDGTIVLIGLTTESISHDLIPPLVSRCRTFTLKALDHNDLQEIILRALKSSKGLENKFQIADEALEYLADVCNGDVRSAFNALEMAAYSLHEGNLIELLHIREAYDSRVNSITTTDFYDIVSAFCKSLRGSQTNSALYWLARMLDSGVDPLYIARRLVVHASEDVGMANPNALQIAMAAQQAVDFVGMPEGRLALAHATVYIAESPKSNSVYKGLARAFQTVRNHRAYPVPDNIRDGSKSYINPIDNPNSRMQYLPSEIQHEKFYSPQNSGTESKIYVRYHDKENKK